MANSAVVGILRAMLTADTAQFDAGMRRAEQSTQRFGAQVTKLGTNVTAITPQAERMVKSFGGEKLLYNANNLVVAVTKLGGAQGMLAGASKLTEAEQQRVNRTLTEAISKYTALGRTAPPSMVALEQATRRVEAPTSMLTTKMVALGAAVGSFIGTLAVSALQRFGQFALEAAANGSKFVAISGSFERLTESIGESGQMMLMVTRSATKGLIADLDLMQAMNKAILLGLPVTSQEMGVLAQTAITLGRAMGQDATKSLDDLITALGRSSPLILDNLGLTVKLGEANEKFARSVGKSANDLTDAERKLAFYRAAMEAARLKTEQLGDVQLTVTDQVGRLSTSVSNYVTQASAAANESDGFASFLGRLADMAGAATQRLNDLAAARKTVFGDKPPTLDETQRMFTGSSVGDPALEAELARINRRRNFELARKNAPGVPLPPGLVLPGPTASESEAIQKQADELLRKTEQRIEDSQRMAERSAQALRDFINFVGEREIADVAAGHKAIEDAERAHRQLVNDLGEQEIRDHERALREKEDAERDYRQLQNQLGEQYIQQEAERQERLRQRAEQMADAIRQRLAAISDAAFGNLAGLFFNAGHDPHGDLRRSADEAKAAYDKLKESAGSADAEIARLKATGKLTAEQYMRLRDEGKASAEDLAEAFKNWRDAEDRANVTFAERFKDLWVGIKVTLQNILNDILQYFVESFIGGLIKGLGGANLGQRLGGMFSGLMGGGGGGGGLAQTAGSFLPSLLGGGGGGGLAAGIGTGGFDTALLMGGGGGGAGAGGAGAGFLTNPAFWTNPWTIAAIGGIAVATAIWKKGLFRGGWEGIEGNARRDKFIGQFGDPSIKGVGGGGHNLAAKLTEFTGQEGGGHLYRNLQRADSEKEFESAEDAIIALFASKGIKNIKKFMFGGFVPPGVVMPSILHGGGHGELAGPIDKIAAMIADRQQTGGPRVVHNHYHNWSGLDGESFRRVFREEFVPWFKMATELNTDDVTGHLARVLP